MNRGVPVVWRGGQGQSQGLWRLSMGSVGAGGCAASNGWEGLGWIARVLRQPSFMFCLCFYREQNKLVLQLFFYYLRKIIYYKDILCFDTLAKNILNICQHSFFSSDFLEKKKLHMLA